MGHVFTSVNAMNTHTAQWRPHQGLPEALANSIVEMCYAPGSNRKVCHCNP